MILPDSRTRKKKTIKFRGKEFQLTFCANCARNGGFVNAEFLPFVFYVCDDCTEKHGRINAPELAEDIARGV